jgi:membrane-bound lytic murein transglycosylase B
MQTMKNVASSLILAIVFTPLSGRAASPGPVPDPYFFRDLGNAKATLTSTVRERLPGEPTDEAHRLVLERLNGAVPQAVVRMAFADPRVRIEPVIVDRFNAPAERLPYERYRQIFIQPKRIAAGQAFYRQHETLIKEVAQRSGVDPLVFLAIAGVETYFGRYGGRFTVFNALYTQIHRLPRRRGWAANELAEFLKLSHNDQIPPHSVKGSYAGAFGYFQFIPSSFNAYAVDFDGDGQRRFDQWPDVLGSIANYLKRNGYRAGETDFGPSGSVWKSIYAYNHSDNYVKVVLELRAEIQRGLDATAAISQPQPGS